MEVSVYSVYTEVAERDIRDRSVVVIDLLRATSTIVNSIVNGAHKVIPVAEVSEAVAVLRTLDRREAVLCGEREGVPLPGFDLGNSPADYTRERIAGKTVVITTTNGTSALHAVRNAPNIFLGALSNRRAVAKKLIEEGRDVCLVCAGTLGRFSADDIYCAGGIVDALRSLGAAVILNDLGIVAEHLYVTQKPDYPLIRSTFHYSKLKKLGFEADLDFCFTEDTTDVVPQCRGGIIE